MNLLRHTNYSNTLKLYRSNWWYSISFTYAPLHSQCDYRHAHLPPVSARLETKLRSQRLAKFSLRNTSVGHVDFNRGVSSNHPPVIEQRKGLFSDLQKDLNPYIRLVRFDRPIGSWLLFWPCGWSIAMSATAGELPDLKILTLFGLGALVMRGAGCTINDLWDKDIDAKVERTKNRPLANKEISSLDAWVFLAGQLSVGLMILHQLNWPSIVIGACSLGLVTIYPLMKRITYWPQLMLGMTFNYGALLGWCATQGTINLSACLPLYIAGISWTIVYDTIYAHQDKVDDLIVGIKSTAIRFGDNTKAWLTAFSTTTLGGLVTSGYVCDQTWPYYTAIGLVGAHLAQQLISLNIHDPGDCARKFISNYQVGFIIFAGIVLGNYLKKKHESKIALTTTTTSATPAFIEMTKDKLHIT